MNERLFDNKYRKKFIKNAGFNELNEYLKGMEKLSKKGGKYLEIYNEDIAYLLDESIFPTNTNSLNIFCGNKSNRSTNTESEMCDTETNIKHINKIIGNVPQINYFDELNKIEDNIRNDQHIKNTLKNFIDIVISCSSLNDISEYQIENFFKTITSLIKDNKTAIYEGYKYFNTILKNHKKKIIVDFIKKMCVLKDKKKNDPTYLNYKIEKEILIQNYCDIYGFESIMATILFNKIYNAYNKMQKE